MTESQPPLVHPTNCPICNSQDGFLNTKVRISDGLVHICKTCSGYFLFPPMEVEYTDSGWTKSRELKWEKDVEVAKEHARVIVDRIRDYLGRPVESVLEIGCGSAFMGVGFNSLGCDYTGIDVDAQSIEFAKKEGINACCLPAEEMCKSDQVNRKYDLILSSNVFEHLYAPHRVFQDLSKICGGIVVIIVPNPKGLFARLKSRKTFRKLTRLILRNDEELAYSIDGRWHNIAYSKETLRYLCEQTGLEPLKLATMGINDRVFGFVQRNQSLLYRTVSGIASLLGMDSELILIAKPEST